jgi:hypothetical protein
VGRLEHHLVVFLLVHALFSLLIETKRDRLGRRACVFDAHCNDRTSDHHGDAIDLMAKEQQNDRGRRPP